MSAVEAYRIEALSDIAIVGWRSWRILPFETLDGEQCYRLCASGTQGIPKVWPPRRAVEAMCSDFRSRHEAPWPDCECGVYAYRDREDAQRHLQTFVDKNGDGTVGWAFGRVSLFGRVVECEHGWRVQHAYPYAVTVHAEPEVAAAIRSLYAIEVEAARPLEPTPPTPAEQLREEVAALRRELEEARRELALSQSLREARGASRKYLRVVWPKDLSDEEVAAAVDRALARAASFGRGAATTADVGDFLENVGGGMIELGHRLKAASMVNVVVQLRRHGRAGPSLWTLPERPVGYVPKSYAPVVNRHAELEERVLEALRAACAAASGPVGITAVLERIGWGGDERTKARESSTAQALFRLKQRGLVASEGPYGRFLWRAV